MKIAAVNFTDHYNLFGAFKVLGHGAVVEYFFFSTIIIHEIKTKKVGVGFGIVDEWFFFI